MAVGSPDRAERTGDRTAPTPQPLGRRRRRWLVADRSSGWRKAAASSKGGATGQGQSGGPDRLVYLHNRTRTSRLHPTLVQDDVDFNQICV
jgi:hypothetical protein